MLVGDGQNFLPSVKFLEQALFFYSLFRLERYKHLCEGEEEEEEVCIKFYNILSFFYKKTFVFYLMFKQGGNLTGVTMTLMR